VCLRQHRGHSFAGRGHLGTGTRQSCVVRQSAEHMDGRGHGVRRPATDLDVDMSDMPTLPESGFVMRNVRRAS
jgi:hypothetical protein